MQHNSLLSRLRFITRTGRASNPSSHDDDFEGPVCKLVDGSWVCTGNDADNDLDNAPPSLNLSSNPSGPSHHTEASVDYEVFNVDINGCDSPLQIPPSRPKTAPGASSTAFLPAASFSQRPSAAANARSIDRRGEPVQAVELFTSALCSHAAKATKWTTAVRREAVRAHTRLLHLLQRYDDAVEAAGAAEAAGLTGPATSPPKAVKVAHSPIVVLYHVDNWPVPPGGRRDVLGCGNFTAMQMEYTIRLKLPVTLPQILVNGQLNVRPPNMAYRYRSSLQSKLKQSGTGPAEVFVDLEGVSPDGVDDAVDVAYSVTDLPEPCTLRILLVQDGIPAPGGNPSKSKVFKRGEMTAPTSLGSAARSVVEVPLPRGAVKDGVVRVNVMPDPGMAGSEIVALVQSRATCKLLGANNMLLAPLEADKSKTKKSNIGDRKFTFV